MTITSSLMFLYIFGESGLLCGGHSKLLSTYHEDFLNFQKKRVYNIVFSFLQRKSGLPRAPNLQKFSIFFTPFLLFTYILAADSYHTLLLEKSERI